jgi:hypothetical protein
MHADDDLVIIGAQQGKLYVSNQVHAVCSGEEGLSWKDVDVNASWVRRVGRWGTDVFAVCTCGCVARLCVCVCARARVRVCARALTHGPRTAHGPKNLALMDVTGGNLREFVVSGAQASLYDLCPLSDERAVSCGPMNDMYVHDREGAVASAVTLNEVNGVWSMVQLGAGSSVLALATYKRGLLLYDVEKRAELGGVTSFGDFVRQAVAIDEATVAVTSFDMQTLVYDVRSDSVVERYRFNFAKNMTMRRYNYSLAADRRMIAVASATKLVFVIDRAQRRLVHQIKGHPSEANWVVAHDGALMSVCDGGYLVVSRPSQETSQEAHASGSDNDESLPGWSLVVGDEAIVA